MSDDVRQATVAEHGSTVICIIVTGLLVLSLVPINS